MSSGSAPRAPRVAFVVSHTHWDREWYRTSHQFRVQLADVVSRVLDALENEEGFEHFLLDGQTVILEDHLSFRPGDEERIRALVRAGKLAIGPWYVLPDEFLISAEAHVRNLIVGGQVGARFGEVQRVGYMPDSFGHIAQMPQILRGAGIDSFIYSRGDDDRIDALGQEYRWRAPDGSEVLAISQLGGYCRAGALGVAETWEAHTRREVDVAVAVDQVRAFFDEMREVAHGDVVLISNGCDHLPPQRRLPAILDALRAAFPETTFRHASLAEFVAAARDEGAGAKTRTGELLGGKRQLILPGVWSTRVVLKQLNDEAQLLLASVVEPVSAYMHFRWGGGYPSGALAYAWRLLMQNHPHDSICGCSTDAVHREMVPRFAGVIEMGEAEVTAQLTALAPTFATTPSSDGETVLCVMNPLPRPRREVIERLVVLQPPGIDPERLELIDDGGGAVAMDVMRSDRVERFWAVDYRTTLLGERQTDTFAQYRDAFPTRLLRGEEDRATADQYLVLRFVADLPALGHAVFRLRERSRPAAPVPEAVTAEGTALANAYVRVWLQADGTFDLEDRARGAVYPALNLMEDTEDIGDEYDYSPAAESRTVMPRVADGAVRLVEASPLRATLEASCHLVLPVALDPPRERRSAETVTCPFTVRVTVTHDSPVVDVRVALDNRARDHRLRARFPTPLVTDELVSEGHFFVNHRPIAVAHDDDWVQPASGTYPQRGFSLVQDGTTGLAVFSRGLHEVEPMRSPAGGAGMILTLLRAVGWLSRDDFPTRRFRNAGPTVPTPDAQCPGEQRFHYAVMPFGDDYLTADVAGWSARWRVPPLAVQGVADGHVPGGTSLLRGGNPLVPISAVKKHETRDTLIVRLVNLTDRPQSETLVSEGSVLAAWRTDLLEGRQSELPVGRRAVAIVLDPFAIETVEIAFGAFD